MVPNPEKIVADYLRDQDLRVVVRTPEDTSTGWVRLHLLAAPPETNPENDHSVRCTFQLDCYAGAGTTDAPDSSGGTGGQPEAANLAATVRGLLRDLRGVQGEAVVSRTRSVGYMRSPDTGFKPARERFLLTHYVWMHLAPVPA